MMTDFDYHRDYTQIDFRQHPELYQIAKGEQGVLLVEPYKSELLPHWRFKTPDIARESAETIYQMFLDYKRQRDFVGMDMARKYLQMGFTRSRRYANHRSGRKYDASGNVLPNDPDPVKEEVARIFYEKYLQAKDDPLYLRLKREHQARYAESVGN